jgi:hypothetical protein
MSFLEQNICKNVTCGPNSYCVNKVGNHLCYCNLGYYGEGGLFTKWRNCISKLMNDIHTFSHRDANL